MGWTRALWVVAYDIADDGRRERVATLLSAYGPRVQLSVFECEVPSKAKGIELRRSLRNVIDPIEDQIRIYPLADTDPSRTVILGARVLEERADYWVI